MKLLMTTLMVLAAGVQHGSALQATPTDPGTNDQDNDMQPLILGGTEVPVGQKTYTCGLRQKADGANVCGGSLITLKHVLTAAHCAEFGIKYVSVGSHFVRGAQDGQQLAVIKQSIHPKFNARARVWDLMVLELESQVDSSIAPVAIDDQYGNHTVENDMATAMGWGLTEGFGSYGSRELLSVDVQLRGNRECSKMLRFFIDDSMMCAGGVLNQGICNGDSGGPLIVTKDGCDVLIGVASWGMACGRKDLPGVFARVSKAWDWIAQQIVSQ